MSQPRGDAKNVVSFIFVTNKILPVRVEIGDRRFVVCVSKKKHAGDR